MITKDQWVPSRRAVVPAFGALLSSIASTMARAASRSEEEFSGSFENMVRAALDELAVYYASAEAVRRTKVPAVQMVIATVGYYVGGDGGGASYVRDRTASPGSLRSVDGAHWRLLPGEDGVVNIKQFGAKGDGVTDDTAAFQAAIDYAQPDKMWITVPVTPTSYVVGTLTIGNVGTTDTCHFRGMQYDPAGASADLANKWRGLSLLVLKAGTNGHMFHVLADASQPIFKNLTLHGNASNQTAGPSYPLYFEAATLGGGHDPVAGWVEDVQIMAGYSGGLYIGANRGAGLWRNMWLRYCGTTASDAAIICHCYDQQFDTVTVGGSPGFGAYMAGTQIQAVNCVWYMNNVHLAIPADAGAQIYTGCVFDQSTTHGLIVNEAPESKPVVSAHGARAFVNCVWSNNSFGATNTYSDISADSVRRLVLVAPQFAGNLGRSSTKPKYCIETKSSEQSPMIRISNAVYTENDGADVFSTAFTNNWSALMELGDRDVHIGSPGGRGTKSLVADGSEVQRWSKGFTDIVGRLRVAPRTLASSAAPGVPGEVCVDEHFIYVCTSQNKWRRAALSDW